MKKSFLLFIIIVCFPLSHLKTQEQFRVMFYNTENLYDTKDNPKTNDDDLTPSGNLHWTKSRYWKKLNDVSKVIISVGNNIPPAIVGLCEVENDSVLFDLTKKANLKKHKYEYVISSSRDSRGSNVAILYQRDQIKILDKNSYRPIIIDNHSRTTRDILHITGKIVNGDTLDIFVCHFPSRNEGIKKTEPFRIKCAELLKQKTDSISRVRKKASIIIMGDFNDYPNSTSLSETLEAQRITNQPSKKKLYNMFYHKVGTNKEEGSYKYRGKWNYLDQFIINGSLLDNSSRVKIKDKKASIYNAEFLLTDDSKKYRGKKPFRTYIGYKYLGGFSDHLPIYMDLLIKR
ncbi:MAG: hypothetical protein QM660_00690 [Dysgonomonas sp.]